MRRQMTSKPSSDVIFEIFWPIWRNLSNSVSAPNFIMTEQETTKLGGVGT